jgi:hypothetical protein
MIELQAADGASNRQPGGILGAGLGGQLRFPRLRSKYAWIQPIPGYHLAKRAQLLLPELRSSMERAWDRALFLLGGRRTSTLTMQADRDGNL